MTHGPSKGQITASILAVGLLLAAMVTNHLLARSNADPLGRSNRSESPVQQVIDLDAHYFKEIRAHQQLWDPTQKEDIQTIASLGKDYHASISKVDLSRCPRPFRRAYALHISEWSEIVPALDGASKASLDREALAKNVKDITRPLEATWARVKQTASDAGAVVRN